MAISLTVNGEARDLDVAPDMPLLWALRDHLQLTGTKFGCGMALCGACTVHLDGQRDALVRDAGSGGRRASRSRPSKDSPRPPRRAVQSAWIGLDVPQCGYCQSGQIMSAAALLAGNPKPSDAQIDAAMSGNICRCATYARIRSAIHQASENLPAAAPRTAEGAGRVQAPCYFRHIDAALRRRAGPELTRRQFLQLTTLAGSGLTLAVLLPGCAPGTGTKGAAAAGPAGHALRPHLPDNTVTVICKHVEVGQGVWTGLAGDRRRGTGCVLGTDARGKRPAQVPLLQQYRLRPARHHAGHRRLFLPRQFLDAAAPGRRDGARDAGGRRGADLERACRRDHRERGRAWRTAARASRQLFGQLASAAARQPVPKEVTLKEPGAFKFIGVDRKFPRLDSQAKSTGAQQFAIDVMLPG